MNILERIQQRELSMHKYTGNVVTIGKEHMDYLWALHLAFPKLLAVVEASDRLCTALDLGDNTVQVSRQEELEQALEALETNVY
jgi:hypothetical protein